MALFLLAVAVYAPLIGWGVPQATAPDRTKTVATDEILPLEGLAEMHNTFVVSKPDRNYGYPWFHYFETTVAQVPYLAYGKLTGQLGRPSPDFPFGFRDPVTALRWLSWIGRFLSVLMGAGTWSRYFVCPNLWDEQVGLLASILMLLSYPMVYYSRTGNPDVPSAFWTSLGLVMYSLILRLGFTVKRAFWVGVFAAVAMATKDQAEMLHLFSPCRGTAFSRNVPGCWKRPFVAASSRRPGGLGGSLPGRDRYGRGSASSHPTCLRALFPAEQPEYHGLLPSRPS